jgi:hypothetical protein
MKLIKEINEAVELNKLRSGFLKRPSSVEAVKRVARGEDSVVLSNGKEYIATKRLSGVALKAGQVVLASYNSYNQGVDICKILGVTGSEQSYGTGGVKFNSVRECLAHYGVKTLTQLEELQDKNEYGYHSYLFVEDMEDVEDNRHERGPWYYLMDGRWSRGSGGEKLSFVLLEEVSGRDE